MQGKLIIGTALVFWLVALVLGENAPGWVMAAYGAAFFVTVTALVAFLMTRGSGWYALARAYPARPSDVEPVRLHRCRTFQMVALDGDQPDGTRVAGGVVSAGASERGLTLAVPSVLRFLFPTIRLPWSAVASARAFEAPGWVKPVTEPGTVFQAEYDPGFRGPFVEIETTAPRTRIRLPAYALEGGMAHLPLDTP